jgi:hypothetical protein
MWGATLVIFSPKLISCLRKNRSFIWVCFMTLIFLLCVSQTKVLRDRSIYFASDRKSGSITRFDREIQGLALQMRIKDPIALGWEFPTVDQQHAILKMTEQAWLHGHGFFGLPRFKNADLLIGKTHQLLLPLKSRGNCQLGVSSIRSIDSSKYTALSGKLVWKDDQNSPTYDSFIIVDDQQVVGYGLIAIQSDEFLWYGYAFKNIVLSVNSTIHLIPIKSRDIEQDVLLNLTYVDSCILKLK